MRKVLLSAVCVFVLAGASMADVLTATDMAMLNVGSPDTPDPVTTDNVCNKPVFIYRFDMSGVIAADGNVAADDAVFSSTAQWQQADGDWAFKVIATSADFDQATVTWNSYTGNAADMSYWDAMPIEDVQAYTEWGNWAAGALWTIPQTTVQAWADAGGVATLALVRNDTYYNTCHWTTLGWDYGQVPKLDVSFIPEPATLVVIALGGLAVLRRRR